MVISIFFPFLRRSFKIIFQFGCSGIVQDETWIFICCLFTNVIIKYDTMIKFDQCSGDQDSVVPLLGSRTLVRELAQDLGFKITVPYGTWFHKGQVMGLVVLSVFPFFCVCFSDSLIEWSFFVLVHTYVCVGGRLGDRVWKSIDLCHSEGCSPYGTICTTIKGFAFVQFICSWPEIAKYNTYSNGRLRIVLPFVTTVW